MFTGKMTHIPLGPWMGVFFIIGGWDYWVGLENFDIRIHKSHLTHFAPLGMGNSLTKQQKGDGKFTRLDATAIFQNSGTSRNISAQLEEKHGKTGVGKCPN